MLKFAISMLLLFSFTCARGEETPFDSLGKKMTEAVKTKNLNLYKECWLAAEAFKEVVNKAPVDQRPPLDVVEKHLQKRDAIIERYLGELVEKANKAGFDTNSAEFVKSQGRVVMKDGMETTPEVSFELKDSKGNGLRLRIDDGLKVDGKWLFTDKPMPDPVVVKNGKLDFLYIGGK